MLEPSCRDHTIEYNRGVVSVISVSRVDELLSAMYVFRRGCSADDSWELLCRTCER